MDCESLLLAIATDSDDHQFIVQPQAASSIVCLNFPESSFAASIAKEQLQTKVAFGLGLYWFKYFGCGM